MLQYLNRGIEPSEITTPLAITHNFPGLSAIFSEEYSPTHTQFVEVSENFTALGSLFQGEWALLSDKITPLTTE